MCARMWAGGHRIGKASSQLERGSSLKHRIRNVDGDLLYRAQAIM